MKITRKIHEEHRRRISKEFQGIISGESDLRISEKVSRKTLGNDLVKKKLGESPERVLEGNTGKAPEESLGKPQENLVQDLKKFWKY